MNVFETINAIMRELPSIGKDKKNAQQGFMYRGIDQFMNALNPLMAKHGLFCTPELVQGFPQEQITTKNNGIQYKSIADYKYTFFALDGSHISTIIRGEAIDSYDKGFNKVCAVALKYVLMQVFMVATEDFKDPDAESDQVIKTTIKSEPVKNLPSAQIKTNNGQILATTGSAKGSAKNETSKMVPSESFETAPIENDYLLLLLKAIDELNICTTRIEAKKVYNNPSYQILVKDQAFLNALQNRLKEIGELKPEAAPAPDSDGVDVEYSKSLKGSLELLSQSPDIATVEALWNLRSHLWHEASFVEAVMNRKSKFNQPALQTILL